MSDTLIEDSHNTCLESTIGFKLVIIELKIFICFLRSTIFRVFTFIYEKNINLKCFQIMTEF